MVLESWSKQYPAGLYPGGQQTVDVAEGEPFAGTRRRLSWRRPAGWFAAGRRHRDADVVAFALLIPLQAIPYLVILAGLRGWRGLRRGRGQAGAGGPRAVVICHNVLPHESRPADELLTRLLLRRAGSALTHSAEEAARARTLAPAALVTVARLAPHLPATTPVLHRSDHAGGSDDAERDGAVRSAPCRLLFFGIVRRYKGLDVLLRALARAPAHVVLTVAGEFWGRAEEETQSMMARLGIAGRVTLRPGYVPADQIAGLFAEADALVLPYRSATSSQNVWLAFAHGVPVVVTRAGTLADAVRDGVDGVVCEPGDEDDLLRALRRISAPGEAARLRSAVRPADPDGHWDAYVATLLSLAAPPAPEPPGLEGLEPMTR